MGETGFTFNQPVEDPDEGEDEEGDGKAAKELKRVAKPQRGISGTYRLGVIHHTDTFADVPLRVATPHAAVHAPSPWTTSG